MRCYTTLSIARFRGPYFFFIREEFLKAMSELLTVSEVARILRVDDTTVRRWVKQGALEAVVLPHVNERQAYRIKRETLEKVLGGSSLPELK
jgi:excisionase family DNA binding protein